MTDKKNPPDIFSGEDFRKLIADNSKFEHGFWMNPTAAGKLFDLCHGSKELPDDEGNMLPCVGCLGCRPPEITTSDKTGTVLVRNPHEPELDEPPPVSEVRNK